MGGFQVCESEGAPRRIYMTRDLRPYLVKKQITISKEDIQDRSKGDILSKVIVLLQVSWFILQVLARAIQHLPITELEISTIAFATLSFVTYFCWWNKPYDIQYPIIISASRSASQNTVSISADDPSELDLEKNPLPSQNDSTATSQPISRPQSSIGARTSFDADSHPPSALHRPLLGSAEVETGQRALADFTTHTPSICPDSYQLSLPPNIPVSVAPLPPLKLGAHGLSPGFDVRIASACSKIRRRLRSGLSSIWTGLKHIPVAYVVWMEAIMIGRQPETAYYGGALLAAERLVAEILAGVLAMAFGAIHCLAWKFDFPTEAEGRLWRASSITIACLPIVVTSTAIYRIWLARRLHNVWRQRVSATTSVLVILSVASYLLARLLLLVQMFVLLRSPNPGIYTSVNWDEDEDEEANILLIT
ncbi:hypothetical protein DXG01_011493 [Tephrocybe rancida]|nr:hypothetical protein DXG01_011493 [Tephrocybe rancida]